MKFRNKLAFAFILCFLFSFSLMINVKADDTIDDDRYISSSGATADGKSEIPCGALVHITTCEPASKSNAKCKVTKINGSITSIVRKVYRSKLSDAKDFVCESTTKKATKKATTKKTTTTKKATDLINDWRWVMSDAASDGKSAIACGSYVKVEACNWYGNSEQCTLVEGVAGVRRVYRNRLSDNEKDALATCGDTLSNLKTIGEWRYLQSNAVADDKSAIECGTKIFVETCGWKDDTEFCNVKVNGSGSSRLVYRNRITDTKGDGCEGVKTSTESTDNNSGTFETIFDGNQGTGIECFNGTSYKSDNICFSKNKKGTRQKFPITIGQNKMYGDEGYLIGWTKDVYDGKPLCQGGDNSITTNVMNKDDETSEINGNVAYYACYREEIGGIRYVQEGAQIGDVEGFEPLKCGDAFYVSYCTRNNDGTEICHGTKDGQNTDRIVYRNKLSNKADATGCSNEAVAGGEEQYITKIASDDFKCGEAVFVTSCDDDSCIYNKVSPLEGEIYTVDAKSISKDDLTKSEDEARKVCDASASSATDDGKACKLNSNNKEKDKMGESSYSICYKEGTSEEDIKKEIESNYKCADGYTFDMSSVIATEDETCVSNKCSRTYNVKCDGGNNIKPILSVSSGMVQANGYGTISVKATAAVGKIEKYYYSEEFLAPTNSSNWLDTNGDSFTIESTPGTKYIWVKDSKGNISNGIGGSVIDTTNTDTTVKKLQLYDENGNIQTPGKVSYRDDEIKSSKYVMLSNNLSDDSKVLADSFNPFDTEYKLEVNSPTISVYATLTSTDSSYISGYEPRTVNLKYGVNTILIKIKNKEGKIRTYTILVTRTDDRTSDNTINDLQLSVGKITFNSNVTDYKVEIPKDTKTVDVNASLSSELATFEEGSEPGTVYISGDTTVKFLKVISQTGSTRTYIITFVKKGTDTISNESLQLNDLIIPGVYLPFESGVANYSTSVDYETDVIDLKMNTKDENSRAIITYKKKSDNEYKLTSSSGIKLDVGENFIEIKVINSNNEESTYRLTIIRKEFGLGISDDTTLKELKVLGYNIKFNPAKRDYTVKIKQEKTLVITAIPTSNRAEVFIRGNDELTGFSTVRVKVVAENGKFETYSIDIKKDAFNKTIEIASIFVGAVIIIASSCIIIIKKKNSANKAYFEE